MATLLEEQVKTPVVQMGGPHLLITAPCARKRTCNLGQLRGLFGRKELIEREYAPLFFSKRKEETLSGGK